MTAKTPAPAATTPVINPLDAWAWLGDLGRHQLAVAAQGAAAMFRGFEAMRTMQQQTAEHAATQYLAAVRLLGAPFQPAELMAVETEVLEEEAEQVGNSWQQLAAATLQSQVETMTQASRLLNGAATATPAVQPKAAAKRSRRA